MLPRRNDLNLHIVYLSFLSAHKHSGKILTAKRIPGDKRVIAQLSCVIHAVGLQVKISDKLQLEVEEIAKKLR